MSVKCHLPDLQFVNYCCTAYGINRGIYNVIDGWFFEQGIEDIVERRKWVLSFLDQAAGGDGKPHFGHGGLKQELLSFYEQTALTGQI